MAKDFAELNRAYDEAGVQVTEFGQKDVAVSKFVKAWENQTARRAAKGGAGMTMALTLAACGGGSGGGTTPVAAPTLSAVDFVTQALAGTLPAAFNIAVESADVGPLTAQEAGTVNAEAANAQNSAELNAAQDSGDIVINVSVEDTVANLQASEALLIEIGATVSVLDSSANILAAAADLVDADGVAIAPIAVTDEAVAASVADYQTLTSLGATYAEGVVPSVADTAANILAAAADLVDADGVAIAPIAVTDEAVAASVADYQTLTSLGATYAEGVVPSVADTAANILAAAADLVDADGVAIAPIAVTDEAPVLTAADLSTLQGLSANFAATPSVEDTLAGADGVAIDGVVDVSLAVGNPTAGADQIDAVINAAGTGTITFNFADQEDTVTLGAGSTISGFTTMTVVAGTVDVTAVDLAGITTISVSSGIVLTAEQYLALTNGVVGGSEDSTVTIEISTAAQAEAVIAAVTGLSGTFAVGGLTFVATAGSGITAAQAAALSVDLEAALEAAIQAAQDAADAAELAAALPPAIQAVEAAEADAEAFVETAMANENVKAADADATTFDEVDAAIDGALIAVLAEINAGPAAGYTAFDGENAAVVGGEIAEDVATATTDLTNATTELVAIDPQLKVLADAVIAAEDASDAADAANDEAAAAVDAAIATAVGDSLVPLTWDEVTGTLTSGVIVIGTLSDLGVLTLNANLVPGAVAGTYTVGGETYNIADLNAVRSAAQAELAAIDALEAAIEVENAAFEALGDAIAAEGAGAADALVAAEGYSFAVRALETVEGVQAAFDAGVAEYNAVLALDDQATALQDAVDTAVAAIENATDALPPLSPGLGIAVVRADLGNVDFDALDSVGELYIYDASDAVGAVTPVLTVSNFSTAADDYIYMGAGVYTLVEVGADETIADSLGSASVLEIFAEETDLGVTLYVEDIPTAGNGTTAIDMVTILEIDGANLADLSFNADTGILTAEAAPVA